jgi:hypothetical protein
MKRRSFGLAAFGALVALAGPCGLPAAQAQGGLSLDRLGRIEPGSYVAGDSVPFDLSASEGRYLLRFRGGREVFVLYVDHGSMGGRILKYDSGETALIVAGWGGLTLYTDSAPQGLPAVRTGDSYPPEPPSVSVSEMQSAAGDDAERLSYVRGVSLQFAADWNALSDNSSARSYAFVALENAARGIERFAGGAGRGAIARRVGVVFIQPGYHPAVSVNGRTLIISFNPGQGFAGCASSRAVARGLEQVLR